MPVNSNKIFGFSLGTGGKTVVTVASPHGIKIGRRVSIFRADKYLGDFEVLEIATSTFTIDKDYDGAETSGLYPIWQLDRDRPTIVQVEGESIDTLRQGVNQVSGDLGNKKDLLSTIDDRRDVVKAINAIKNEIDEKILRDLILSIATN